MTEGGTQVRKSEAHERSHNVITQMADVLLCSTVLLPDAVHGEVSGRNRAGKLRVS